MFVDQLNKAWREQDSMLCVGLDPDLSKLPAHLSRDTALFDFCRNIVDATAEYACAFKPQAAYFSAVSGEQVLEQVIAYIHENFPAIPVILDAKRGDIGATATMYAREAFERYKADAVTVNPYMGGDTLEPFTDWADRGVVVLCRTSNPGSGDLQALEAGGGSVALQVATLAAGSWNRNGNMALVVGATWPAEIESVRETVGDMPLLIPGIGAQGGDLEAVLRVGLDSTGYGLMINASRSILYASDGKGFATAAGAEAARLKQQISQYRDRLVA